MIQRLGMVIALSLGVSLGSLAPLSASHAEEKQGLPMQELRAFAEIFGRIKQNYVEPVDDKTLIEHAIRGMLSGLDPHSSYLDVDEYKDLREGTSGEFGGLGIEVGQEDGFIRVIAPIDDTPAQRAGVKAGDMIIRLDEKPVKGMSLEEAVNIMRGKPGTEIVLTISREGEDKPLKITIVRDVIKVVSVKGRLLEEGFAYLRIAHFQARTTEDMLKKLQSLKAEAGGDIDGLVLDLRNNPGGVLSGAVSVSDAFLTGGNIVYTKGRTEESRLDFKAAPDDALDGAPIVVLVNGGSASASEIVAGALQDHKRAVIMGSRTFGKGSVQTIVPVNDEVAVKLTTARYYTPLDRSIQGEGIVPDIELSNIRATVDEPPLIERVKESDLSRHLDKGKGEEEKVNGKEMSGKGETRENLAEQDYPLNEALNLLKGLHILQGGK